MEINKEDFKKIINILDKILTEEDFNLYKKLKNNYQKALDLYERKASIQTVKSEIEYSTRMIMEAPPKNKELGMQVLLAMDALFKKIKKLT